MQTCSGIVKYSNIAGWFQRRKLYTLHCLVFFWSQEPSCIHSVGDAEMFFSDLYQDILMIILITLTYWLQVWHSICTKMMIKIQQLGTTLDYIFMLSPDLLLCLLYTADTIAVKLSNFGGHCGSIFALHHAPLCTGFKRVKYSIKYIRFCVFYHCVNNLKSMDVLTCPSHMTN